MSEQSTYVRIEGEPFLSRALAFRERRNAWRRAWSVFAEARGATGFVGNGRALVFAKGPPPEGWGRPSVKDQASRPKKGHPDVEAMEQLRAAQPEPKGAEVYQDAICCNLSWTAPDGSSGSGSIGDLGIIFSGPSVGWVGDVFVGYVPDAEAAVRDHAQLHPEHRVEEPAASWRLPDGLIRISKAEYDLLIAEHTVAQERAAAGAAVAAE